MSSSEPARTSTRRIPGILVAGLLLVIAAALSYQLVSSSTVESSLSAVASRFDAGRSKHHGGLGEADGALPDDTTVFDDELPGIAELDPALRDALRNATVDAASDDVELIVTSGWRSAAYQDQLLREAVAEHGSEERAARWVATPETSAHVSGDAVDIGTSEARSWLSRHGDDHGLCQVYGNEPWHFELHPEAIDHGCPPLFADPSEDPRMAW